MRSALAMQTVTFLLMLVGVGGLALEARTTHHLAVVNSRLAREGKQAHDGLCTLKADFRIRIGEGDAFLRTHPHGIPGITAADIQRSITLQQATLDSLAPIRCRTGAGR